MYLSNRMAGEEVIILPDWAYRTLAKKGRVEDVANFSKMRQWFSQEQLIAIDQFSQQGLSVFWHNGNFVNQPGGPMERCANSLSYLWFFPGDAAVSENGTDSDSYAKNQLSNLSDNKTYSLKLVEEHILCGLRTPNRDTIDLDQSYSVYSGSSKLIVVVIKDGILAPLMLNRLDTLRLSIIRSIVKTLQQYHDPNVVNGSRWFTWYLQELMLTK